MNPGEPPRDNDAAGSGSNQRCRKSKQATLEKAKASAERRRRELRQCFNALKDLFENGTKNTDVEILQRVIPEIQELQARIDELESRLQTQQATIRGLLTTTQLPEPPYPDYGQSCSIPPIETYLPFVFTNRAQCPSEYNNLRIPVPIRPEPTPVPRTPGRFSMFQPPRDAGPLPQEATLEGMTPPYTPW